MEMNDIYKDIALRSGGDIYLGVVGPVRTGKSTFITNFINKLVIPNIINEHAKDRAIDELPQSADGSSIMTTQPKFIPNEAVKVNINDSEFKVRLIDCVGYMVSGAKGFIEGDIMRKVKTPWSDKEMPFDEAAEFGTKKVITDHSNIAVVVTTDGSFTDLERESYEESEQRVIHTLKEHNKPFVVIYNTNKDVKSAEVIKDCARLQEKYQVAVLPMNVESLSQENIVTIFDNLLNEFPLNNILVKLPTWMEALDYNNQIILELVQEIKKFSEGAIKIGDFKLNSTMFKNSENFEPLEESKVLLGEGNIALTIKPRPNLFYKVLSSQCGLDIQNEYSLVTHLKDLAVAKREYDKLKDALESVKQNGYGVVSPNLDEMRLEDPEIVKQGSKFGVKLKASAPSLHIMKVDVDAEVNPIVGTEQQSEELVKYLLSEFENDPQGIWDTEMFGKSLHELVNEGLTNKIQSMPQNAQNKMRKTLGRIVNEGKGGVICILL